MRMFGTESHTCHGGIVVGQGVVFLSLLQVVYDNFVIGAAAGKVTAADVHAAHAAVVAVHCKALLGFLDLETHQVIKEFRN